MRVYPTLLIQNSPAVETLFDCGGLHASNELLGGLVAHQFFGKIQFKLADHFLLLPLLHLLSPTSTRYLLNLAYLRQQGGTGRRRYKGGRLDEMVSLGQKGRGSTSEELAFEV